MPNYSLTKPEAAYLNIEIDKKVYQVPLGRTLKVKELRKLMKVTKLDSEEQFDFMLEFFGKYIPEEVIDELTQAELLQLFNLWTKANEEVENMTLGES